MKMGNRLFWLRGLVLVLSLGSSEGQMVRNDAIGNDPAKEKLCLERELQMHGPGKAVPFMIDLQFVKTSRSYFPDETFIVVDRKITSQLVECDLNKGTGRYEPVSGEPENWPGIGHWHLIRPQQFSPGLNTREGMLMVQDVCRDAIRKKIRDRFAHSVVSFSYLAVQEIRHSGTMIAGTKADPYDIVVKGTAFYKSDGPDLAPIAFSCLLSPMLDVRAVQFK
jgi:hypothetical protein